MALVAGGIVMLLWNAILPEAMGAHPLSYWHAVGLLILCRILFGNFRSGRPGGGPPFRQHAWRDKWLQMDPEQRRRFRDEWQQRCRQPSGNNEGNPPAAK